MAQWDIMKMQIAEPKIPTLAEAFPLNFKGRARESHHKFTELLWKGQAFIGKFYKRVFV